MKKLMAEKLLSENLKRSGVIERKKVNSENRSVPILISTETPVRQYDFWSDSEYDEILLNSAENIDLTRAENIKLLYDHGKGQYGELPIGKLQNVRIENKELRADAIFSKANPAAEMLWQMVLEGTLTDISVGGTKRQIRITEREGNIPLVEVIKWEFIEASLVDIGADPNTGVNRKLKGERENMNKIEELKRKLEELKKRGADATEIERKSEELNIAIVKIAKENSELKRKADIKDLIAKHPDVLKSEEIERFLSDETKTDNDVARALLATKVKKDVPIVSMPTRSENQDLRQAVTDAILIRSGIDVKEPHKDTDMFRTSSLQDIIRVTTGYTGFDRDNMIKRAMSTSDFPILLGNVANKVLASSYAEAAGTFNLWTAATELSDFKTRTEAGRSRLAGRLRKLVELGKPRSKEVGESSESWRLYSYGDEVSLTREMIIDDDLGAFTDLIKDFAAMGKRTANGLVYDLLQGKGDYASYKMGDGKAIFDATAHKNYTPTGAAISISALTTARTAMRRQKDAAGSALNIVPKFLLAAPEQETTAKQILTSTSDLSASNAGVTNPFKNAFNLVIDAELDAAPWYLAASGRTIKVGYLTGSGKGPKVAEKNRDLRGVTYECVFDFGLFAEDYRGLYKNNG